MCCMEKRSGIWVSLLSLGGPDQIISVNVKDHVNIYADWLLLYAKPLKSCCQPLQQMFSCRHLSSVPLQSIIRAHGCEIMSAADIFFKVLNVVVLKGSIQLPSRVEIKNFACYLDQYDWKVAWVPSWSTSLVWSRTRILNKFALLASAKIPLAVTLMNTFRGLGPQRSPTLYGGKKGTWLKDQCFFSLSFFAQFQGAERGSDQNSWLGQQCHLLNEMFLRQKAYLLVHKYYSTQALC